MKGRILAFVFVEGVNVEMVRAGWAEYYTNYGEGRYQAAFALEK